MEGKSITITYLELRYQEAIQGTDSDLAGLRMERLAVPCPSFNAFMYRAVGGEWFWVDRVNWSEEEWSNHVQRDTLETWAAWRPLRLF